MIDGINKWIETESQENIVVIAIGDGAGNPLKTIDLTPKDACELGREIIAAAYAAKGVAITNIVIGAY